MYENTALFFSSRSSSHMTGGYLFEPSTHSMVTRASGCAKNASDRRTFRRSDSSSGIITRWGCNKQIIQIQNECPQCKVSSTLGDYSRPKRPPKTNGDYSGQCGQQVVNKHRCHRNIDRFTSSCPFVPRDATQRAVTQRYRLSVRSSSVGDVKVGLPWTQVWTLRK